AFGLTGHEIAVFRLVHEVACRMARAEVRSRPVLSNWQALIAYLQTAMAYEQIEQFRVLFLDCKNNLIAGEVPQRRTVNDNPARPRELSLFRQIPRARLLSRAGATSRCRAN